MLKFLKTTVVGGLFFLIPLVVVVVVVGKALQLMMVVAKPLDAWIPAESIGGVALANSLGAVCLIVFCFG